MRLLFITDYTEQFPYRLLRGILSYAGETEPWVVCRMNTDNKRQMGMRGVIDWAKRWKADVVIGQFDPDDDVSLFERNGIVAIAQDYITKFRSIPNITADYDLTGSMVAKRFLSRGFKNFAFFGYHNVCWSDERYEGFRKPIEEAGLEKNLHFYNVQEINHIWAYNAPLLAGWLKKLPKPIGIMACDDNQGNILVQACNYHGIKIPSEVAVIGVDNDEIICNLTYPALSSVDVNIEGGGYEVARLAERMVKERDFRGEDIVLHPMHIVSRTSSNIYSTKDADVLAALEYISANREHKISVGDILKQVPLSRRLLEQRFLKVTGYTIYKYISLMRMERFAQLLISSKDSIADIAARLDEPDTKSISRRFQALWGCTPSEYRQRELRKMGI